MSLLVISCTSRQALQLLPEDHNPWISQNCETRGLHLWLFSEALLPKTVFAIPNITASNDAVSGFSHNVEMDPPTLQTMANAPGTVLAPIPTPFPFYHLCSPHALWGTFCIQNFKHNIFIHSFLVCHSLWQRQLVFQHRHPRIWHANSVRILPWTLPGLVLCSSKM